MKFYYIDNDMVKTCSSPSKNCKHEHYYYLASAARQIASLFSRQYHYDEDNEIRRCDNVLSCSFEKHYNSRYQIIKDHKKNYDFSGKYRALEDPFTSLLEAELADFIEKLGLRVIRNSNNIISPYEIDIYLPDVNIAIEFNGTYWHSDEVIHDRYGISAQQYHLNKYSYCDNQNTLLLFVWESNWIQDWITIIDMICDAVQFRRVAKPLRCFNKAMTPFDYHCEIMDRKDMLNNRIKVNKKLLKQNKLL